MGNRVVTIGGSEATVEFPTGGIVGVTETQTLTNKTLTTPIIASFYQDAAKTKLMTTPVTASDTLVALAATQTLTNKSLTSPTITGTPSITGVPTMVGATGGAATAALLFGAGTTVTPCTTATANKNYIGFWADSTATSGDSRLMYIRQYFSGAGVSGEALRAYGTVNNVTAAVGGTVNGAHISLSVTGASGAISGQANALRATLDFADSPTAVGGTCAVITADTNIAAGPTIPANTAYFRTNNVGTQKIDYFASIVNPSTAMVAAAGTGANSPAKTGGGEAAKALLITIDGVDYWIGLFSSNS